jgi:predicted nucleic acid-binding protein
MPGMFADTSGLACLADPSQPFHALAVRHYRNVRRNHRIVTTNYVIAELVALLTTPLHFSRRSVIGSVEFVKTSPRVEIVHIDPVLDDEAWQLLKSRPDKEWSLVDCASFVVMTRRGLTDALTTDHHFEQAGFVRLLK